MIEEKEPVIVSKFIPIGMMFPVENKPVEEVTPEKEFRFLPALLWALLLVLSGWFILFGWG